MELHADGDSTDLVGLILTTIASRQVNRSRRQIEGFAVPVKSLDTLGKPEAVRASADPAQGKPADLLQLVGVDPGAQGAGDELCAEADPQDRLARL